MKLSVICLVSALVLSATSLAQTHERWPQPAVNTAQTTDGQHNAASTRTVWASSYRTAQRTASGERFDPTALTTAHRSLRFGTTLLVKYQQRSVVVRVNDLGPFVRGRELDLSWAAAQRIQCLGVCRVQVTQLN